PLSEESFELFLQCFQAVIAEALPLLSGQPLKRDEHSTDLCRGVNGGFELFSEGHFPAIRKPSSTLSV
ncbi:hypothetical protein, partial [Marinobacter sp. NSM]|uniref:hypothetical protein n=1 Tax=Marinobacter sp. NSM TaxID=3458004 RepID=UPI00403614B1